ncbi:hypothetical protein CROQUDRAFT_660269 [Cronartium quercuum f. sp. fusiforme G11]|uniref:Uncharacterized protein n=1 Tax=Cronartium quercuum f. sp. fusiforme G11 TaxID=708437 RepID=A0A9P6NHG5_9BASI|nr:hypothetical protein CROQUDRAFT_660269 [Cronartium quercuum f. sp. fusiforme G11]
MVYSFFGESAGCIVVLEWVQAEPRLHRIVTKICELLNFKKSLDETHTLSSKLSTIEKVSIEQGFQPLWKSIEFSEEMKIS